MPNFGSGTHTYTSGMVQAMWSAKGWGSLRKAMQSRGRSFRALSMQDWLQVRTHAHGRHGAGIEEHSRQCQGVLSRQGTRWDTPPPSHRFQAEAHTP